MSELAWAAGFFDGEGWSTLLRGKYPQLGVAQKDQRPLIRFLFAIDGRGSVYKPGGTSNAYQWRCSVLEDVLYVLSLLWPYLSEPKKEQWKGVLEKNSEFSKYSSTR